MSRPFEDYTDQFFWDFKRMDNVNYNFRLIETQYRAKKHFNDDEDFNKPIIILLVAIIECCLFDFLARVTQHRHDPLPNMSQDTILFLRESKEPDIFKTVLDRIKSQNLLRVKKGEALYDDLDFLRKVRNRIHIQNKHHELDVDKTNSKYKNEYFVYIDDILLIAQNCFEKVINVLCNVYPRGNKSPLPMSDFPRPWL